MATAKDRNGFPGTPAECRPGNGFEDGRSHAGRATRPAWAARTGLFQLEPDVFAAMGEISRGSSRTKIVAYTASVEVDIAVKTLRSGASGYIVKGSTAEELRDGIIAVLQGETFATRSI